MGLSSGDRLGPYEVVAPLGAGGMGEVYRARDTRLGRSVAIKVLPESVSRSDEHRHRFEREARAIAALNHPNICTVHDVGRSGDVDYLVMELVEGETLAQRLKRGALPPADVLRFGAEIARALARAHRAGVLHRDLKPGNVMLTKTGAKLMDFGLARMTRDGNATGLSQIATQSSPITGEGTIVGTFQYMAPEQLEGHDADARSDIWALGATLYEMATGKRAFDGASTASVISSIMREEPRPLGELAPMSPPELERLVRTCLAKDPDARWQSAADLAKELTWTADSPPFDGSRGGRTDQGRRARLGGRALFLAAGTIALALGVQLGWSLRGRSTRAGAPVVSKVSFAGGAFDFLPAPAIALAPDGSALAVTAPDSSGTWRLLVRRLDEVDVRAPECPHGARMPFWSPDSKEIGYVTDEDKLVRRPASGGEEQPICDAPGFLGGTWGPHGVILFSGSIGRQAIFRVSAAGGTPEPVTTVDTTRHEFSHVLPSFLPDGVHFLYTVGYVDTLQFVRTRVASISGGLPHDLLVAKGAVRVSPDGSIVYVRDRALLMQHIARDGSRLLDEPVVVPGLPERRTLFTFSDASASVASGLIAYPIADDRPTEYRWVESDGAQGPVVARLVSGYVGAVPSPDGRRAIVYHAAGIETYLNLLDLTSGEVHRLTPAPWKSRMPIWTRDSNRICFDYFGPGGHQLCMLNVDDPTKIQPLFGIPRDAEPTDLSPSEEAVLLESETRGILVAEKSAGWRLKTWGPAGSDAYGGAFFHTGAFLIHSVDVAGVEHIAADEFPEPGRHTILDADGVASGLAVRPFWLAGDVLFYVDPDRRTIRSVTLTVTPSGLIAGKPTTRFIIPAECCGFGLSVKGRRFLVATPVGPKQQPSIALIQNWGPSGRQP